MILPSLKVSTDFGEDCVDNKTLFYNFDDLTKLLQISMMCDVSHVPDVSCVMCHVSLCLLRVACCVWFSRFVSLRVRDPVMYSG